VIHYSTAARLIQNSKESLAHHSNFSMDLGKFLKKGVLQNADHRCNIFEQSWKSTSIRNKMSNFSDKFAETTEIPPRSTNIQLSQAKVNLVATEGNGALT
jgi:hypothetical protein